MSRPGTKRRLQRKQQRKKSEVWAKSTECVLWFLGETVAKILLWSEPLKPAAPPWRLLVAPPSSGAVFRSKVISVMLVVLFIGGRGLFPNIIFFNLHSTLASFNSATKKLKISGFFALWFWAWSVKLAWWWLKKEGLRESGSRLQVGAEENGEALGR